jgi:small-conductance mechanosensitive channel
MKEDLLNTTNAGVNVIVLLILAALLFLLLRLIRRYLPILPKKEKNRALLRKQTQIIEIAVWVLFICFVIPELTQRNVVFLLLVIFLLIGFIVFYHAYYVKDYVAGVVFRMGHHIDIDDVVTFAGIIGRVKKFNNQNIEIETNSGEIYYIPYSQIKKGIISKLSNTEQSYMFTFTLRMNVADCDVNKVAEIKQYLLTFPSVSTAKPPIVKYAKLEKGVVSLEVSFISLDDERNDIIVESVRNKFKGPNN